MGSISTVTDGVDGITAQRMNVIAEALAVILGITDDAQSGIKVPSGRELQLVDALLALWQDLDGGDLKLRDGYANARLQDLGTLAMPQPLYLGEEYHGLSGGSAATAVANRLYLWPLVLPVAATLAGGRCYAAGSGNVLIGLYSDGATLTKVAETASTAVTAGDQSIYFTSNYSAAKALYWLGIMSSVSVGGWIVKYTAKYYDVGSFSLPASFSKPSGWLDPAGVEIPSAIGLISGGVY